MRIPKSLYQAVLIGFCVFAATPTSAGQRTVIFASQVHSAAIRLPFIGASTGSPCLPTNVLVEPCREWYGRSSTSMDEGQPRERDKYGLSYIRIGHYRYYD